jgi:hypothetical protein
MSAQFVRIKNISRQPVSVRLNSGAYCHIPPSKTVEKVYPAEVENNKSVENLTMKRLIELKSPEKRKQAAAAKKTAKAKTGKSQKRKKSTK